MYHQWLAALMACVDHVNLLLVPPVREVVDDKYGNEAALFVHHPRIVYLLVGHHFITTGILEDFVLGDVAFIRVFFDRILGHEKDLSIHENYSKCTTTKG